MKTKLIFVVLFLYNIISAYSSIDTTALYYRLNASQTEKYYAGINDDNWDIDVDSVVQEVIFHQEPIQLVNGNLPIGTFLKIITTYENIESEIVFQFPFFYEAFINGNHTEIKIADSLGKSLTNIVIKNGKHTYKYDNKLQLYKGDLIKKNKPLFLYYNDNLYILSFEESRAIKPIAYNRFTVFFKRIGYRIKNTINNIRYNNNKRNKRTYNYFVTNKPKYLHLDTVYWKAFILNKYKNPIQKKLVLSVQKNYYNNDVAYTTAIKGKKGNYNGFFIVDSNFTIDNRYELVLKKNNKKYVTENIHIEDYELQEYKYELNLSSTTINQYSRPTLTIDAKDYNGFLPSGAIAQVQLRITNVDQFSQNKQIVDRIFWKRDIQLNNDISITKINLPTDSFPNIDFDFNVVVQFYTEGGLQHFDSISDIQFNYFIKNIETIEVENDTIFHKINNQQKNAIGKIYFINSNDIIFDSATIYTPYSLAAVTAPDVKIVINDSILYHTIPRNSLQPFSKVDSFYRLWVNNPQQQSFNFELYKNNHLIKQGVDTVFSFTALNNESVEYTLKVYGVKLKGNNDKDYWRSYNGVMIAKAYNSLHLLVNHKHDAEPGSNVNIQLKAIDTKHKPVKKLNLTAYAINQQFDNKEDYSAMYLFKKHVNTKRNSTFNLQQYEDKDWILYDSSLLSHFGLLDSLDFKVYNPLTPFDTIYIPIAENNAQFFVYTDSWDKLLSISIDGNLVYVKNKLSEYSVIVPSGKHNVTIKTNSNFYTFNNVLFKSGYKLLMPINYRKIRNTIYQKSYQTEEKNEKRNLDLQLSGIVLDSKLYNNLYAIKNGTNIFNTNEYSYRDVAIGPINDIYPTNFYFKNGDSLKAYIKTGCLINIQDNVVYAEKTNNSTYDKYYDYDDYNDYKSKNIDPIRNVLRLAILKTKTTYNYTPINCNSCQSNNDNVFIFTPNKADTKDFYAISKKTNAVCRINHDYYSRYSISYDSFSLYLHSTDDGLRFIGDFALQPDQLLLLRLDSTDKYLPKNDSIHSKAAIQITYAGLIGQYTFLNIIGLSDTAFRFSSFTDKNGWINISHLPTGKYVMQLYNYAINSFDTLYFVKSKDSIWHLPINKNTLTLINNKISPFVGRAAIESIKLVPYGGTDQYTYYWSTNGTYKNGFSSEALSMEDIKPMPTRNLYDITGASAGAFQLDAVVVKDMNANSISIGGARESGTVYYVAGVKVMSNPGIPDLDGDYDGSSDKYKKTDSIANSEPINQGSTIRKNFKDYAFWYPNLITDKNGEVQFEAQIPDNVTAWETKFIGLNRKGTFYNTSYINAYKNLLSRLYTPRFAIVGDTFDIVANVSGKDKKTFIANSSFLQDSVLLATYTDTILDIKSYYQIIVAPTNRDTTTVLFTTNFYPQNTTDAEQKSIPIFPQGIEKTEGQFWLLENDTTFTIPLYNNTGNYQLAIQQNESILLEEELKAVINYSFDCNEQLTSKIKAKILLAKLNGDKSPDAAIAKYVKEIIKRKNNTNDWGWWQNSTTDIWMNQYIYNTCASFEKYKNDGNLRYENAAIANNYSTMNIRQKLLYLTTGNKLLMDSVYMKELNYEVLASKSSYNQLKWYEWLIKNKVNISATDLLNMANTTTTGQLYYEEKGLPTFYTSPRSLTALACKLLYQIDSLHPALQQMKRFLLSKRENYWNNTFETVSTIEALLPLVKKEEQASNQNQAYINKEKIDATTIYHIPSSETEISINKKGNSANYISLFQMNQIANPPIVDSLYSIKSSFIKDGKAVQSLQKGKNVDYQISITAKKQSDYVMIVIPIPAGTSVINKSQGLFYYSSHVEYWKDKVILFCDKLPLGNHTITLSLQNRFNGSYTVNPIEVKQMYMPLFNGNNQLKKLKITD